MHLNHTSSHTKPPHSPMLPAWLNPFYTPPSPFEPTPFPALLYRAPLKFLLHHAYHLITALRSAPTPARPPIRVVCISDTHTLIPSDVPQGIGRL
jgi:hypothetical protein